MNLFKGAIEEAVKQGGKIEYGGKVKDFIALDKVICFQPKSI